MRHQNNLRKCFRYNFKNFLLTDSTKADDERRKKSNEMLRYCRNGNIERVPLTDLFSAALYH